jgi:bacteriocin-like protein
MSKTTAHNTEVRKVTAVREPARELSADELAQVTGGVLRITNIRANANGYSGCSAGSDGDGGGGLSGIAQFIHSYRAGSGFFDRAISGISA